MMQIMGKNILIDFRKEFDMIIENGTTEDFIKFAKQYNIFQSKGTQYYHIMCKKIKDRLDREGLDYEIVRPE